MHYNLYIGSYLIIVVICAMRLLTAGEKNDAAAFLYAFIVSLAGLSALIAVKERLGFYMLFAAFFVITGSAVVIAVVKSGRRGGI